MHKLYYRNPEWLGPIILPYGNATMTFNDTGVFEWSARSLPLPGDWRDNYGGGAIYVISDQTNDLPLKIKEQIANAIINNSEIPGEWIGIASDGVSIDFNRAIFEMLPNAKEYYTARAEQLVPFDVQIIIE